MALDVGSYDYDIYAALAVVGTFLGAWFLLWLAHHSRWAPLVHSYRGVAPNFLSVIGVLFALNLVFLANDTWHAHDQALDAVYQEVNSLRNLLALSASIPEPQHTQVRQAVERYAQLTVSDDWPALAHRQTSQATADQLDRLLAILASPELAGAVTNSVHSLMLQQAFQVRNTRGLRVALSQTHVNPLKWVGMAFLGFLMMVSLVMVHVDQPRAELMAVMLFAAAATPTAAIVLIQGNPFQQPIAVSAAPLAALVPLQGVVPAKPSS